MIFLWRVGSILCSSTVENVAQCRRRLNNNCFINLKSCRHLCESEYNKKILIRFWCVDAFKYVEFNNNFQFNCFSVDSVIFQLCL